MTHHPDSDYTHPATSPLADSGKADETASYTDHPESVDPADIPDHVDSDYTHPATSPLADSGKADETASYTDHPESVDEHPANAAPPVTH